jgi:hypothetical protein
LADEVFKEECRSRDCSRSPTATFHNTKSSKWIENFNSLASEEQDIDGKASIRKDIGNQYLKENIKFGRKKSSNAILDEYSDPPRKHSKVIKPKVEE